MMDFVLKMMDFVFKMMILIQTHRWDSQNPHSPTLTGDDFDKTVAEWDYCESTGTPCDSLISGGHL